MPILPHALSLVAVLATAPPPRPPPIADEGAIEVVVEAPRRPDWLFPGLDHPRVQAFFASDSLIGPSLLDAQAPAMRRPLVRAGAIKLLDNASGSAPTAADRRAARRFARAWIAAARPALEACYADALARTPTEAARLTVRVDLRGRDRGATILAEGTLGDVFGNACVHGVLELADVEAPAATGLATTVEIPVWFWLQTV